MNGTASVYFPYTSSNSLGTTKQIASLSSSFSPDLLGTFGFGMEYQDGIYYGEIAGELPFLGNAWSTNGLFYANFYTGSGVRLALPSSNFAIRIGGILQYNYITNELGKLDNINKTLTIDGDNSFVPSFIVTSSSTNHSQTSTIDNVDYSMVSVSQSSWGLAPKLGFEYINTNGKAIYRLNIGYNFSYSISNQITINQYTRNNIKAPGDGSTFDLNDPYFNYHFNNNTQNAPATFNNLFLNFQLIGFIPAKSSSNGRN
jgi:hypothetical protein